MKIARNRFQKQLVYVDQNTTSEIVTNLQEIARLDREAEAKQVIAGWWLFIFFLFIAGFFLPSLSAVPHLVFGRS